MNISKLLIGLYILLVFGFSAVTKADYKILPYPNPVNEKASQYVGTVAQTIDGEFYLIIDAEKEVYFQLDGEIDLTPFNGWVVKIIGIENKMYKVGPVSSIASFDPLTDRQEENVAVPRLKVLTINAIAQVEQ